MLFQGDGMTRARIVAILIALGLISAAQAQTLTSKQADIVREAAQATAEANELSGRGEFAAAATKYRQSLNSRLAVFGKMHTATANAYFDLCAALSQVQGSQAEALQSCEASLEVRRKLLGEYALGTGRSYLMTGILVEGPPDWNRAEPYFRKALEIFKAVAGPTDSETVEATSRLSQNLNFQGRTSEAKELRDAVLATKGASDPNSLMIRGDSATQAGDWALAASSFGGALSILEPKLGKSNKVVTAIRANLGAALLASKNPVRAEAVLWQSFVALIGSDPTGLPIESDSALAYARASTNPEPASFFYLQSAYLAAKEQPQRADELIDRAFVASQQVGMSRGDQAVAAAAIRRDLSDPRLAALVREQQTLIQQLADYEARQTPPDLATINRFGTDLAAANRKLAVQIPTYFEQRATRYLRIADVQNRLGQNDAVLVFAAEQSDIYVFAISKRKAAWIRVEKVRGSVETAIRSIRNSISSAAASDPKYSVHSAFMLYSALIKPLEGTLADSSTVYVVPVGGLSGLPLQLLLKQDAAPKSDADWLGSSYAFITLPGVGSLQPAGSPVPALESFVGFGDADFHRANSSAPNASVANTLAALPGTRDEILAMSAMFEGASKQKTFLGEQASERNFFADASVAQASVLAIATHGFLANEIDGLQEPGLVLSGSQIDRMSDGLLLASEVQKMHLRAAVVILSACNTGSPEQGSRGNADSFLSGDGLSGLSRAFLFAGAHAVLASHWSVDDRATAALTTEFLRILRERPKTSSAQALQLAAKAIRTGKRDDGNPILDWDRAWYHPAYWAPFALIAAQAG